MIAQYGNISIKQLYPLNRQAAIFIYVLLD